MKFIWVLADLPKVEHRMGAHVDFVYMAQVMDILRPQGHQSKPQQSLSWLTWHLFWNHVFKSSA